MSLQQKRNKKVPAGEGPDSIEDHLDLAWDPQLLIEVLERELADLAATEAGTPILSPEEWDIVLNAARAGQGKGRGKGRPRLSRHHEDQLEAAKVRARERKRELLLQGFSRLDAEDQAAKEEQPKLAAAHLLYSPETLKRRFF